MHFSGSNRINKRTIHACSILWNPSKYEGKIKLIHKESFRYTHITTTKFITINKETFDSNTDFNEHITNVRTVFPRSLKKVNVYFMFSD